MLGIIDGARQTNRTRISNDGTELRRSAKEGPLRSAQICAIRSSAIDSSIAHPFPSVVSSDFRCLLASPSLNGLAGGCARPPPPPGGPPPPPNPPPPPGPPAPGQR